MGTYEELCLDVRCIHRLRNVKLPTCLATSAGSRARGHVPAVIHRILGL
jgi:hypothetical protein